MILIDIYFDAAMAMITGEAVAIWICLAVISALITYVLWRRHQTNPGQVDSRQGHNMLIQNGRCERRYAVIPILVFYIAFVLTITIIERIPGRQMQYNLELFWTIREVINGRRVLIPEIFWNIVLFVPIGVLISLVLPVQCKPRSANGSSNSIWRSPWIVILAGFLLSTGIEVTQLLTYRGLFEFDDILYNTLGTGIGVALFNLVRRGMTNRSKNSLE